MLKKIIAIAAIIMVVLLIFTVYTKETEEEKNKIPFVNITYPTNGTTLSKVITISGTASDRDSNYIEKVEILVDNNWEKVTGNTTWSFTWEVYGVKNGNYAIRARSFDGTDYSEVCEVNIKIENPETQKSDAHKWAIFIEAANFPDSNDSKLGNGGLYLAEEMAAYLIEKLGYSTDNIIILFDDGWIRKDNGYGKPIMLLQQRDNKYDITYADATKATVMSSLNYIVTESNKFGDSEVFIWIAGHGEGNSNQTLTGGKLLQQSMIFLWNQDEMLTDKDLGDSLQTLKSDKVCIIVDTCFSGGFADKTIFGFREFFLFKTGVVKPGRVVISGSSKFRPGWASTTDGPLFSFIWFNGIKSGEADGYRPGLFDRGRKTVLNLFKDKKVSVEEAFYYASYVLRTDDTYEDYKKMEPQINDQYPRAGLIGSLKGLFLG